VILISSISFIIPRLKFYDRNKDAAPVPRAAVEYKMKLPASEQYKDAHQEMADAFPNLSMGRIETFLGQNNKTFENKCIDLYAERYIRYFRVCHTSESGRDITYVTGAVWAEMKKNASYRVDFSVDSNSVVEEAQCEWANGQGPTAHCRNIF